MIDELYISKSFCCLGKNTNVCLNCAFCRVSQNNTEFEYSCLPSNINPSFDKLPISINLFYGDPLIQREKTLDYLLRLEKVKHKGPVVIITKGDLESFYDLPNDLKLDLHLAFSTFGIDHEYDRLSHKRLIQNLEIFRKRGYKYHKSIEFRPICYGINDSKEIIEGVFKIADEYNTAIGYSGLQGIPEVEKYWKDNKINLVPYPGFKFGHKKSISGEVQWIFDTMSKKYDVPIFRKTSCLISYTHHLERDYNAHYYRPKEMNCDMCLMKEKCFSFKEKNLSTKFHSLELIPFHFTIENKTNHECILKKKGICEFPSDDCSRISGDILVIKDDKLTTADVRVIKWLTGLTVDADFEESSLLNEKWRKIKKIFMNEDEKIVENSIEKEWEEITRIREEKVVHPDGTCSGSVGFGGVTGTNGKSMELEDFVNHKRSERLKDILDECE